MELRRALVAEAVGTAFLLLAIVGSGVVVADAPTPSAALFPHAVVVGAALVALILALGPVSGAHLNPAVSVADALLGGIAWDRARRYVVAQLAGGIVGTLVANLLFGGPALAIASQTRAGLPLAASEAVATFGLLLVIFATVRARRGDAVAYAVGAYIAAAIVATSSTSFANPAVTVARMLTDTWTGIAPASVPGFLGGQAVGVLAAVALVRWLLQTTAAEAADVLVPHEPAEAHDHRPR